jgi:protein TonB
MKSAIKVRSKRATAVIPRVEDGPGVNDNVPARLPGHELSDLEGVPRQPAAESVVYYNRVTLIESFPAHPADEPGEATDVPAMEAKRETKRARAKPGKGRVAVACICSFLFHAAVFAALVTTFVVTPAEPEEEAGQVVSVIMLGNSDADEQAAGEENKEPEQVVADAVQPETVQPTEAEPEEVQPAEPQPTETQQAETAQAVQPTAAPPQQQPEEVQPAQPEVSQVSPETVVTPEPEVMTSTVPAEPTVVQPMATQVPEAVKPEAQPPQPADVQPSVQPVETAEVQPEPQASAPVATPVEKPPVARPKEVVKKQPPKKAKVNSGSQGQSEEDAKRGSAEGLETAQSDQNSQSAASRIGWGSAAVANYPGKVQSRIRRSVRVPTEYKRMTGNLMVRVRLTISAGGDVASLSLARSSGIPELDQAVIDGVRRAAPFPPLPPEWGKPSWTFAQEVQVTGQ